MSAYPPKRRRHSPWGSPQPADPIRTGLWRLSFALPGFLALLAKPGRHAPCLMGCLVTIGMHGYAVVDGTSRERVLEQATAFLRMLLRELRRVGNVPPATSIPARMRGPMGESWCRTDSLYIAIGADVTFAEGGIEPYLPVREEEPAA